MMLPFYVSTTSAVSRSEAIAHLNDVGIETRPILTGNFVSQPAVRRLFPDLIEKDELTAAETISDRGFMIGCHQDFSEEQIEIIRIGLSTLAGRSLGS
jgi:CDP-6-deoxy-D-xylo-4-hexulose-3-dehydrase